MNNKKSIEDKYNELIETLRFLIKVNSKSLNNGVNICIKKIPYYNHAKDSVSFREDILFFDFNNYTNGFGFSLSPEIIEDLQRGEANEDK